MGSLANEAMAVYEGREPRGTHPSFLEAAMKEFICAALAMLTTLVLVPPARSAHPTPGGHDAVVLCRTRSGKVKVRPACRLRQTRIDPVTLGLCDPSSIASPPGCGPDIPCPGEGKCVDGACACLAIAQCIEGFRWDPSPRVCACVPVTCP